MVSIRKFFNDMGVDTCGMMSNFIISPDKYVIGTVGLKYIAYTRPNSIVLIKTKIVCGKIDVRQVTTYYGGCIPENSAPSFDNIGELLSHVYELIEHRTSLTEKEFKNRMIRGLE